MPCRPTAEGFAHLAGGARIGQIAWMQLRHDWTVDEAEALIARPFHDLLAQAHDVHRASFDPAVIEAAILLSIKTGACPEDCAYCPQSARYDTGVEPERLMSTADIAAAARVAQSSGATRFCMGAAWRSPNDRQVTLVADAVRAVAGLGMETCVTLGMLTSGQARALADAGLDFYNHNLDTSPEFYGEVITTRTYDDRLETLSHVRDAGVKVCCGGIVGMGESRRDRAGLLTELARLDPHPESVPINLLVQVPGTPLFGVAPLDGLELVRTVAAARLMMPASVVRLSAGRTGMSDELQALCLHAGASSIFLGDRLLTTPNPGDDHDRDLLERLDVELAVIDRQPAAGESGRTRATVSTIAAPIRSRSSVLDT
jgi:biotin synthase